MTFLSRQRPLSDIFGAFDDFWGTHNRISNFERSVVFIDTIEKDDRYVVTADIPGVSKKELDIRVKDGTLIISGERKNKLDKEDISHRSEISYGQFKRSFTLPRDANPSNVEAECVNGVLTVNIFKKEESKEQKITIK